MLLSVNNHSVIYVQLHASHGLPDENEILNSFKHDEDSVSPGLNAGLYFYVKRNRYRNTLPTSNIGVLPF